MSAFLPLTRNRSGLAAVWTGLLEKGHLLRRAPATSSPAYWKGRATRIHQGTRGDLTHSGTSCKDGPQRPESVFEEENGVHGPGCEYAPPAQEVERKWNGNWVPLMNPSKSSLPHKAAPALPLQIPLQRDRLASVTAVLEQTMPLERALHLQRWRQRMIRDLGEEGFAEYMKNIFQQGKLFHAAMEGLLLAKEIPVKKQEEDCSVSSYIMSIKHVLQDVTGVRALESAVKHETLHYQGLVDCVAEYRGSLCLIDWKTSGKSKPLLRSTFDGPLQIAAYIGAINHDRNYNFQVNCGLLVIAYKDGSPAHSHYMDSELCSQYWNKWLLRLQEYKEKGEDSHTV